MKIEVSLSWPFMLQIYGNFLEKQEKTEKLIGIFSY